MTNRITHLINILNAEENNNLPEKIRLFESITHVLFTLTQSLYEANQEIDYHQHELENKYFRFGLTNHSILKLIQGNNFSLLSNPIVMTDVFSIFSLTRMQIEAFTIMYYLFFDKETIETLRFRYDIYKLHGIRKQSSFVPQTEKSKLIHTILKEEISKIEQRIKESNFYAEATPKVRKQYLNPKYAKLISTDHILDLSKLKSNRFNDMWSLYSNHAHSEHISDRQYNAIYKNKKSTIEESCSVLTVNTIMTAKLCILLTEAFVGAKKSFESQSMENKVLIETWGKLGIDKNII